MTNVTVHMDDEETVAIRIEDREFFGLALDEHRDVEDDRGMKVGVSGCVELTLRREAASELLRVLAAKAVFQS